MRIGVISDTHGWLDPKVFGLFTGVNHILHAGDIGPDALIAELETIAPVTAVTGNTDSLSTFRLTEAIMLAGRKFLVHHIVDPYALREELQLRVEHEHPDVSLAMAFPQHANPLQLRVEHEHPDVVVFGHTHKAFCETSNGVLFFNPGSAGKPQFGRGRTVAILHCDEKGIRPEFLAL